MSDLAYSHTAAIAPPSSPPSRAAHVLSQLKLVLPGGAIVYWFSNTLRAVYQLAAVDDLTSSYPDGVVADWSRTAARAAIGLGLTTVLLFIYVLVMPWFQDVEPDYRRWRQSGFLSTAIPALTASIVAGFLALTSAIGVYTQAGWGRGVLASLGVYALAFGILGLISVPKIRDRRAA